MNLTPPTHLLNNFASGIPEPVYPTGEEQYLDLMRRLLDDNHSSWVFNERVGKWTRTLIGYTMVYDCRTNKLPLVTTRLSYAKMALNEKIGYLRGYDSAAQFNDILGVKTWFRNANHTKAWLANPNRRGEDHIGRAYGVQLRQWQKPHGGTHDQLMALDAKLSAGIDDRGLLLSYYNPGELDLASLRPCLYTMQFSLVNGTLFLDAKQRSVDVPLGLNFNMVQMAGLLQLMAHIYGFKPGIVQHHLVNCHLYEDQIEGALEQVSRTPFAEPTMSISPEVKSLQDVLTWFDARKHVTIHGYEHHPAIEFPFSD